MKLSPPPGLQWSVFVTVVNRDILQADGTLDDLYGLIFPLGSFPTKEAAEQHIQAVVQQTGCSGMFMARYGAAVPLRAEVEAEATTHLEVGRQVDRLENQQYQRENQQYQERLALEEEIAREAEQETDPTTIEYFQRQCYLALKNHSAYQEHRRAAEEAWQQYQKRQGLIREHYRAYPEHERDWLEHLRLSLSRRGESTLYQNIAHGYTEIREELLGEPKEEEPFKFN